MLLLILDHLLFRSRIISNIKGGGLTSSGDVNVGTDTSTGVVLTSPNGTQYRLIVDDSGNLSTVAV